MAKRDQRDRRGFGMAVVIVSLFLVLMSVMATIGSQRSADARRVSAAGYAGRLAEQLGRSAIEESLASLTPDLLFGGGNVDGQGRFDAAFLATLDAAGAVKKDQLGNPLEVRFPAALASALAPQALRKACAQDTTVTAIDDVSARPVSFTAPNWGVLRLKARVKVRAGDHSAERFVVEERQFALDPSSPSRLKIGAKSLRTLVLRKADEAAAL
ncbi:MAG: hypothetical protein HYY25_06495 [Candidatus Wallbacteria bacterium]|nr:hypothetical protein [Candidatus Wallbacteria bacterium]